MLNPQELTPEAWLKGLVKAQHLPPYLDRISI